MRYIDFDGVILDTEELLFEEWRKNPNRFNLPEEVKIKYIQDSNWKEIVNNSKIINDSIYILKNIDPNDNAILTRIHSLYEGEEKIKFLRRHGVKQEIILAPYKLRKDEVVSAKDNILIDDSLRNLKQWVSSGGYPMFFDKEETNIDPWGMYNEKGYQRVLRIDEKRK